MRLDKLNDKGIAKWFHDNDYILTAKQTLKPRQKRSENDATLEHNIQSSILHYLHAQGIFAYRQNTGVDRTGGRWISYGVKGGSDIVCVISGKNCIGKYVAIEVKGFDINGRKTKQSESQKNFQQKLEKAGGDYHVVWSLDEVIDILKKYD